MVLGVFFMWEISRWYLNSRYLIIVVLPENYLENYLFIYSSIDLIYLLIYLISKEIVNYPMLPITLYLLLRQISSLWQALPVYIPCIITNIHNCYMLSTYACHAIDFNIYSFHVRIPHKGAIVSHLFGRYSIPALERGLFIPLSRKDL